MPKITIVTPSYNQGRYLEQTILSVLGQLLWKHIFDLLSNMGFRYMGNFSQMKSPLDGTVLQADSIFVKGE